MNEIKKYSELNTKEKIVLAYSLYYAGMKAQLRLVMRDIANDKLEQARKRGRV